MGIRTAALTGALLVAGCMGEIVRSDHVESATQLANKLAPQAPVPIWETVYPYQHADFVQFASEERLLIGTVELGANLGIPEHKSVMMVDSRSGKKVWETERRNLKNGRYSVVALEPRIVVLGANTERLELFALEPATGARAWAADLSAPRATAISPDGRRLYAITARRTVSAFDLATGQAAWTQELPVEQLGKESRFLLHAESDALLVAGSSLVRLAADSGKVLWTAQSPELAAPGSHMAIADGGVLAWSTKSLAFIDLRDGRVRWQHAVKRGVIKAVMPQSQRVVQIVTFDPAQPLLATGSDDIEALDPKSGAITWSRSLGGTAIGQTLTDDLIAVSLEDDIVGLDAASGTERFRRTLPDILRLANPLAYDPVGQSDMLRTADRTLYLGRESAGIVAYSLAEGTEMWRHSTLVRRVTAYPYSMPARLTRLRQTSALYSKGPAAQAPSGATTSFVSQPNPMRQSLERDYGRLESARRAASSRNDRAEVQRIGTAQVSNLRGQIAALQAEQSAAKMQSRMDLASSVTSSLALLGEAIQQSAIDAIGTRISMEIDHTTVLHQNALQGRYYVRPFQLIGAEGAQGTSIIDVETGHRAEVMTSPFLDVIWQHGIEAPHYVVDPSGTRLVTIGIGLRPERWETYVSRTARQPRPSLLAYDITALKFGPRNQILEKNLAAAQLESPEAQFVSAARTGNIAKLQRMLSAGMDVNARSGPGGFTAFSVAAETGRQSVAQVLLHKGADVNRLVEGRTALDYASDPAMQKLIVAAGGSKAADLRR